MSIRIADTIKRMQRVLQQRGISATDSEDFIQEAFGRLEIYRREKPVQHPEGFLVRTAVNISIDQSRRKKRENWADTPVEEFVLVDNSPLPDEVFAARERLDRLTKGFEALDAVTRQMIAAKRIEGLPVAAIAQRHGLSVSAVEKRLAKGILFLTNWMEGW